MTNAITSSGPEEMNSGEATTGSSRRLAAFIVAALLCIVGACAAVERYLPKDRRVELSVVPGDRK